MILPEVLYYFPDVPKSIFKFSKDGLTDKEKYLEIKTFMKHLNIGDSYWYYSFEISNFLIRLYYNNVISINELFTEIFIDKHFVTPYRFLEHCNCKRIMFDNSSIISYLDFRMDLVKEVNEYIKHNEGIEFSYSRVISIHDDSTKSGLMERYESVLSQIILQVAFNSFYTDEIDYHEDLKSAIDSQFNADQIISEIMLMTRMSFVEHCYERVLNNYDLEDFMLLYLFFNDYEGEYSDNTNIIKFKEIIKKVYKERGIE